MLGVRDAGRGGQAEVARIRLHPVIVEIPLPAGEWSVSRGLTLAAALFFAVALLGRRARSGELVLFGALGAALAAAGALGFRGVLVELGAVPIYGFGALLVAGMTVGWLLTERGADRAGLPREATRSAAIAAVLSGVLGARIVYVLANAAEFHGLSEVFALRDGGLCFYGGLAGGVAGTAHYLRRRRLAFFAFADAAAPGLALGTAFGDVGSYLGGSDYGRTLSAGAPHWLARLGTFPRWPAAWAGSPAWIDHVVRKGLPADSVLSLPVHPTELYAAVAALFIALGLAVAGSARFFRGQIFLSFVLVDGWVRFLLDWIRDDPERGLFGPRAAPALWLPLGALVFWAALAAGPLHAMLGLVRRRALIHVLAVLAGLALYTMLRPHAAVPTPLSVTQWFALASAAASATAWRRIRESARPPPGASIAFTPDRVSS